ncbi:MAG: ABC transporter permease subunit, partial [Evtepia sp.]|nr:ABC transporter permease subunit [Evtepia sp.]
MEWAQLYTDLTAQLVSGTDLPWWQDFFVNFYRAFVDGGRWTLYLKGVLTTLRVTALALIMGIVLGVLVAIIRSAHDQQRPGRRNPILGILNLICKIYTTVIRGTPMIVQMLIMGSIIFASSRNFTIIGTIALGINSGAYVSEIIRGGLMSLDP